MATKYISIKVIMDKLLRHPMLQGLSLEAAIDYAVDFMRIVGCPAIFTEKTEVIPIECYKGLLPCDYYEMIQVRGNNFTFRYSTDSFHLSGDKSHAQHTRDLTYKIQGDYIFTSLKEGEIEIAYTAIETDENGRAFFSNVPKGSYRIIELIDKRYFKKPVYINWNEVTIDNYNTEAVIYVVNNINKIR